jgi:Domain of unknown function (DUF4861)
MCPLPRLLLVLPTLETIFLPVAEESTAPSVAPVTWCRFIPERKDDFAWENDLSAFRACGPAMRAGRGVENSGIDVWLKRVSYPMIDRWYAAERHGISYHSDHGEGTDACHTGSSRGCGGTAVWQDGEMVLADPQAWRIIERTSRPSLFELTYCYDLREGAIVEFTRITIELKQRLFLTQSTFTRDGAPSFLAIAVGLTIHEGHAVPTLNPDAGWVACWKNLDHQGVVIAVLIDPAQVVEMCHLTAPGDKERDHPLLVTRPDPAGRVRLLIFPI